MNKKIIKKLNKDADGFKICSKCFILRPLEDYHKYTEYRLRPDCKHCRKLRNKAYYKKRKQNINK